MAFRIWTLPCLLGLVLSFAVEAQEPPSTPSQESSVGSETGLAAVYSNKLTGHKTASGKQYDPNKLTAAHKTLPFGTRVEVTNVKNDKHVELTITDRGPRQANRILDITPRAAQALGIRKLGMAQVSVAVLK